MTPVNIHDESVIWIDNLFGYMTFDKFDGEQIKNIGPNVFNKTADKM